MKAADIKYAFAAFVITNSVWVYVIFNNVRTVRQVPQIVIMDVTDTKPPPLLTLFTTWNSSMENENVYNNTMTMWKALGPQVSLVLFTNDAKLRKRSEQMGWKVLPMVRTACNNTPILKDMFITTMSIFYESQFYGYSNSDILYDNGLLNTLTMIMESISTFKRAPVLITGRRIDSNLGINETIHTWKDFDKVAKRGQISNAFALDYFIMTKGFNWLNFPDLVIGRPKIDNWLMFHTRRKGVVLVDASASITALHQKTVKRKRIARDCNKEILIESKDLKFKQHKVLKGNAECAPYETRFGRSGALFLVKRGLFTTGC